MSKSDSTVTPSTSVEATAAPSSADNRPAPHNKSRNLKQRFNIRRNAPYPQKSFGGSFNQPRSQNKSDVKSGFTTTVVAQFKLDTWLTGLEDIAKVCYNTMKYYDDKCARNITMHQFTHVCKLAAFVRLYDVATQLRTYSEFELVNMPQLTLSLSSCLLPQLVCSYCEAIGEVEVDFTTIVPGVVSMRQFFASPDRNIFFELDPATGLYSTDENGHRIPCSMDNFYKQYPLRDYATALTRSVVLSKSYRSIIHSTDGHREFLCSWKRTSDDFIRSYSFTSNSTDVAKRGGAFKFRDEQKYTEWLFDSHYLRSRFYTEEFDHLLFIAETIRSSWEKF